MSNLRRVKQIRWDGDHLFCGRHPLGFVMKNLSPTWYGQGYLGEQFFEKKTRAAAKKAVEQAWKKYLNQFSDEAKEKGKKK